MQPEYRLSKSFIDRLNAKPNSWAFKTHGSEYQQAGLPDIIGCYRGRFIGIEVKMPGNSPSAIQYYVLGLLDAAQGRTAVAYSWDDVQGLLDAIDSEADDAS